MVTLAAAGAIPPLSLAVGANEVYWTQDGAAQRRSLTKLKGRTSNPNRTYCQRPR
ncbi:hypothetical protein GKE82_14405 [Conexibacter sp. W3-3-2]|uniref:hypothetical protein n=1 Tax=Conexibacter sp. W3-3-2 TaxID=2675227 RepID=UPI0012B806E7|nr:hypothetical protein [Conexibacter sp. W3-3-2]MTD45446.1 hypothetical protein [Conexibacter sp. W3-3-2]